MFTHPIGQPFRFVQSIYVHLPTKYWPNCGICAVQKHCDYLKYSPCKKCGEESVILKLIDCPNQGACKLIINQFNGTHVTTFNFREVAEAMDKSIAKYKPKIIRRKCKI